MSKIAFILKMAAILLVFTLLAGGIRAESVAAAAFPRPAESAYLAPPHMIANPAAKYCGDLGFTFSTEIDGNGAERGMCTLPDATACDAWDFLEGKCGQAYSYCATLGLDVATVSDGENAFSTEYAVCVNEIGQEIGTVSDLSDLGDTLSTCGTTTDQQAAIPQALTTGAPASDPNIVALGAVGVPPAAWDWRNATYSSIPGDWTTPIKNQGGCGSCWAYSAAGVSEAAIGLAVKQPNLNPDLAEEFLITGCFGGYTGDCCGGWHSVALQVIRDEGIPLETDMPSVSIGGGCECYGGPGCTCAFGPDDVDEFDNPDPHLCSNALCNDTYLDPGYADNLSYIAQTGYVYPGDPINRTIIKQALITYGPLAVAYDSYHGSFDANRILKCTIPVIDQVIDHAVSIVGYSDAGSYWIVKNSWGTGYEDNGFFKVGYGQCLIEEYVYYAIGENTFTISGTVSDDSFVGVPNVRMTFQPDSGSPVVVLTDSTGFYSYDVPAGWTGTLTADKPLYDFSLVTPATGYTYTNVGENWFNQDFDNVQFHPNAILLVDDDDNGPDVSTFYTDALNALNILDPAVTYDVFDTNNSDAEPDAATLAGYEAVIWFSGQEFGGFAGPGLAGETALAAYLNGGGSLLISSQDYFLDHGRTSFMANYLGAAAVQDDIVHLQVTGSSVFGGLGPYSMLSGFLLDTGYNYSDGLTPGTGALAVFNGPQGGAALVKDNGTYRTAFFGFPLEILLIPPELPTYPDPRRSDPPELLLQAVLARFLAWDNGYLLTLTSSPAAGGTIAADPLPDLATRYEVLDPATDVDLTPSANTGYAFDHWTGDASGDLFPATVTMDMDRAVTAVFVPCYKITTTLTPGGYGSVTAEPESNPACNGGGYPEGTVVTLTADYNPGRDFLSWSGAVSGTELTIDVTMDTNKAITANFTPCYSLETIINPSGGGTIDVSPALPTCRDGVLYKLGTEITLTAIPGVDSSFISWSGSASGSVNPAVFTMTGNKVVTANFIGCYTLTINADPTAGGSVTTLPAPNCPGGRYVYGTSVRVTEATNPGFAFSNWSGDASGTSDFYILSLTDNRTANANFTPCYALDLTMASGGTGTLTVSPGPNCGTNYLSGTTVTLGAVPATYNYFLNWSGGASGSSTPVLIEMDSDKAVTASFITAPTIPALVLPISGDLLKTDAVTLDWSDSTPALNLDHYQLQVDTVNTFSSPDIDENSLITSTYDLSSLTPNTSYYWRVRAFDAYGHARGWSSLRSFRTALTQPALVSPMNGDPVDTAMPTLTWTPVTGASGYNVQIASNDTFTTLIANVTLTGLGTTYAPTAGLPVSTIFHWRVRSLGVNGPSDWSVEDSVQDSFLSANPPGQPALSAPLNNFLLPGGTFIPTLTWNAPTTPLTAPAPDNYHIQIATTSTFADGTRVVDEETPDSTRIFSPSLDLASNTLHYWRVRGVKVNGISQYGIWSLVRTFRTPFAAPTGLNLVGTTAHITKPTFAWTSPDLTGVTGFNFQIARDAAFATLILNTTTSGTTQQYTVSFVLPMDTPLWWRVRAMGANGPSNWTSASFTSANPPGVPNLLLLGSNALTVNDTPTLTWSATGAVHHYQIQVDNDSNFGTPVADTTVLPPATYVTPSLPPNATYYWRVRSYNEFDDYSLWSAVRTFRTALVPPNTIEPVGGVTVPTTKPPLDWDDVAGATGYNLQVFRDVALLIPVLNLNMTGPASTYTPTTPLPAGITLYWRVRSLGANGPSDWSGPSVSTFVSANPPTIPNLVTPAANALTTDYTPALTWTAATAPVVPKPTTFAYYQVQVDNNSDFTSPEVNDTSVIVPSTVTFSPGSDLAANTTYSWRVRAVGQTATLDYQYSQWSAVRTFRTALLKPELSGPAEAEVMLQTLPAFSWGRVTGATGYSIQISRNNTFTSMVVSTNLPASTSPTITYVPASPLPPGLTLWWRVNSLGTNGPSEWSVVRTITSANPPGIPNLLLPGVNALSTSYTPTLTWGVVPVPAGTVFDYYQIQLSDTSAFVMPVLIDKQAPTLAQPSFTPAEYAENLPPNATYYWRVRSFNSDGQYSQWSAVRTFRTAVLPPVLSAPATLATMLETMPTFTWEAVENATGYTIQISRNTAFTSLISNVGTNASTLSFRSPALPAGAPLYWRVQAKAVNGPSGWSEVRSFTPANPPGIPIQSLPGNNALVTIYQPAFTWGRVSLPAGVVLDHYQLQISTTSNFTMPVLLDVSVNDPPSPQVPTYTPDEPLLPNATYYWRVRSFNNLAPAQYSQWSAVRSFRTSVLAPALGLPSDGETVLETMPTFTWDAAENATGYNIQIARNSTFTSLVRTGSTNAATLSYKAAGPLPVGATLYWRVQTKAINGPSGWSEARSFTPANPPSVPNQILPANNVLTSDYTPTFTWGTVSVPAGTLFASYQLQIDTDNFVEPLLVDDDTLVTPTYTILTDLAPNTTHYWRVRSLNMDGQYSQWSLVRILRTAVLPPALVAPGNAETMVETRPTFTWDPAANATGYTLQVSRNNTFTSLVVNVGTNASTLSYLSPALPVLPGGAPLYWRVQTKAINGPSGWSEVRSFTPANPPGIPNLVNPGINALTTDFTPLLTWGVVPVPSGVTFMYYEIEIDNNINLPSPEIVETVGTLTAPNFTPGFDLEPNTTYYWHVRSYNSLGQYSQWSAVRYFRTSVRPPVLDQPADASSASNTLPLFDWDDVPAATGYTLQISNNAGFTSFLVNASPAGVTSQYTLTSPLAGGQVFYWRVQTKGINGPSAWSPVSWFTSAYPPGIPSPVSPANNVLVYDLTPVFGWNTVWVPAGAGRSFDYYQIQIDTDTAFAPAEVDDTVTTYVNPSYTPISELTANTTYYWRVRSYNVSGQYSQWSTLRTFRTALPAPGLLLPADAGSTSDTTPTFDWGDVTGTGVDGYTIQISTSAAFTTTVISTNTVGSTYTPVAPLPTGTTYYWRVRTRGTNGPSDWSEVWSVTVTP